MDYPQQSNCFSRPLGDFDYCTTEKLLSIIQLKRPKFGKLGI